LDPKENELFDYVSKSRFNLKGVKNNEEGDEEEIAIFDGNENHEE